MGHLLNANKGLNWNKCRPWSMWNCRANGNYNAIKVEIWKLAKSSSIKASSRYFFSRTAPLFEKERNSISVALNLYGSNPLWLHGPGAWTALSADNYPRNPMQIYLSEVFKQRLN